MENELVILLEKFLYKQASAEEIARLKMLFNQAGSKKMLSVWYKSQWAQASDLADPEIEERIWRQLQEQNALGSCPAKIPLWKRGLRVAASILLPVLFVVAGYYYSEHTSRQPAGQMFVYTDTGQKTNLQLPDGTHIWLNSASSLQYDHNYNKKDRIVRLQGEAYFEVNKDAKKPFIVEAGDLSVEAVGTSFDVKAYSDDADITTTLIEGCVRVSNSGRSELLSPNEKLVFSKNNREFTKILLPDAERYISWRHNQLAFEQERLEDIAKMLERMYGVQVRFISDNLKDIRFSGKIKNNNLESVLQIIAFVSPIRYSIENDSTIIILENSPKKNMP